MDSLKTKKWFIIGALVGNIMEFFDFIIYAYLSKYIAINFFPHNNQFISKLLMFSVFSSGYLARPIGAVIFGYIGDKFGRKIALVQSIIIITLATTCIGLLPTYNSINLLAPVLLVVCRLVQGFAVSGEQSGVAVYLSENFGVHKNGFIGSLVLSSSYFGVLLGSLVCFVVSFCLSEQSMNSFGWRIPFLLSMILGVLSLVLRINGKESLEFKVAKNHNKLSEHPVYDTFSKQWKDVTLMILLVMSLSVPIYMYTIYLPNYLVDVVGIDFKKSLFLSTISLCFISGLVPVIGKISDQVGNEKTLLMGLIVGLLIGCPIFSLLSSGQSLCIILGQFFFGVMVSFIAAPMLGVLLKVFPVHRRYTGVSFVFNTSMAIFGSTVPIVCISLIEFSGNKVFPGVYLSLSSMVGIVILYTTYYKNYKLQHLKSKSLLEGLK
jgi:MHS family proline/betaine transporter-like MFS transporter